jgi:spore germination protein YaaH
LVSSIVDKPKNRQKAIEEITKQVESQNIDGVNINLEYVGEPSSSTINNFTIFVSELRKSLPGRLELTVDVFADSAIKRRIFDIPSLAEIVDRIIVMGYDFYRPSSPQAGPIAPIRDGADRYEQNLSWSLAAFLKLVPAEKIVLGVPYYGYEWQTLSNQPNSMTIPETGALATYKRVRDKIAKDKLQPAWDPVSLSPYLIFKEGGHWHQIYYENETSLAYKYQLVRDLNLGGIAIWALGYDGEYPDLWNLLEEKFARRNS